MKIIRNTASFALVLTMAFGLVAATDAQSVEQLQVEAVNDFVIGPGKAEIVVEPGDSANRELRVTSRIPGTTTFSLTVEDFTGSDDPNQTVQLLGDQEGPYSLRDFVELPVQEFTLEFGERITLPINVNVPDDIEPGGRYGAIIVSNAPSRVADETEGAGAVIVSRLGSLFLVRVDGEINEDGQLTDFRISGDESVYTDSHPEQFEILFENNGSVHLVPYGLIEIKNLFGSVVDTIPVGAYFALPDSQRSQVIEWTDAPTMFGYYKAELNLSRGYDDLSDELSLGFWILPWQPIVIGLLIIVLLAVLITVVGKKFEIKRK